MKKWLIRESSNLICFLRMFGSIAIAICGIWHLLPGETLAFGYSLLLISDLFDGYCYRNYVVHDPPKHWFNRLPVTLDPLADLVFTISGTVYVLYDRDWSAIELTGITLCLTLIALVLSLIITGRFHGRIRQLATILLTYGCFGLMVVNTALIWKINTISRQDWCFYFGITLASFYYIFFNIVPKERWLRY